MASAAPPTCNATRELHVIGHSAGSFSAMVISEILEDPKFSPFYGCTRATAVALPGKLFETHHVQRKIHLYHVRQYTERPEGAVARIVAGVAAAALRVAGAVHRAS